MPCPVIIPLDQSLHYGPAQIGSQGILFGKLFAEGIPVPETVIIPAETLYRLAQENQLYDAIAQKQSNLTEIDQQQLQRLKKHVHQVMTSQKLPSWFIKELLQVYHRKFTDCFVTILPAHHLQQFEVAKYLHITGEANLLESLMAAWADLVCLEIAKQHHLRPIHLAPTPLLLQAQYQPVVSGLGYSAHPRTMSKNQVYIKAIWGSPDSHLLHEESDTYAVDIRSWQVVEHEIAVKTKQFRRESDKLLSFPVPEQYQHYSSLSEEQVIAIGEIIHAIKQKRLSHHIISWELAPEGLFVTGLQETAREEFAIPTTKKTMTKLMISTGNPQKHLPHLLPAIDGVGVLRSEYTLAKFGVHPLHVIQSKQKQQLLNELVKTIQAYQDTLHHKPIIYRSQNFTSSELRQLRYSENYEPSEPNPYLGYRGGLQLVRQPKLLEFELAVMRKALEASQAPLAFMPAFVRTPHELEYILAQIEQAGLLHFPQFSVWLQLNTPENILNLRSYPTHKLAGVSVNVTSINALLLGIDPDNPEISEHYSLEKIVIEKLLEQLAHSVAELQSLRNFSQPLQLNLHLESFSHDLVALAIKLGYHGITVKPAAAQIAHATMVEIEEKQLAYLQ